ncbi:MAG: hypothetical protein ACFB15_11240 [Cyclobacteriaceae bacterium]
MLDQIVPDKNRPVVLAERGIEQNPDQASPETLNQKTVEALQDYFSEDKQTEMNRYAALAGSGKTSYDIHEIAPAAVDGRIDALFVVEGTHRWDHINQEDNSAQLHDSHWYPN